MEKQTVWRTVQTHMMTGIGYMIPVIVSVTIVSAIAQLGASMLGWNITGEEALTSSNILLQFLAWIIQVAAPICQNLMYPMFAGFLAYSISDRLGLTAGFFGGLLAVNGGSGFLGALVIGFFSGYFMLWISKVIKVSRQYRSIMNMMLLPLIGTFATFVAMFFVVNPLGNAINNAMQSFINSVGAFGTIPLVAIIAAMMAFDCGGPINKAAFGIGFGLAATGFSLLPVMYGAMIAPLGFGLAVFLDKYIIRKKLFKQELADAGFSSFILGLFNVTEGAIPLVLDDPIWMVPINVIGTAIGASVGYMAGNFLPITRTGNVLGFLLQENPLSYVACLFLGAFIVAGLTIVRRMVLKKKETQVAAENSMENVAV